MALVMAFFLCQNLEAQDYHSSVGVRLSWGGLISYKHQLNEQIYGEGILSIRWGGPTLTGLLSRRQSFSEIDGLYWFAGAGLHLGYHGRNNVYSPDDDANEDLQINLGLDVIGGVEYQLANAPFSFCADYKPAFYFTGDRWFVGEGLGLSIRYVIR